MYEARISDKIDFSGITRFGEALAGGSAGIRDPEARWYAIWTRSRQEKAVSTMLDSLRIRHYLPLKSELRQWSDRKQVIETAVFSGYLFVHLNLEKDRGLTILRSRGVVAFVGNKSGPLPIPDQEIEDISTVLSSKVAYSLQPSLNKGDHVRVVKGTLAGVEGTLISSTSGPCLLVSIEMIQQSLALRVSREDVELICPSPHPVIYAEQLIAK